MDDRIVTENHHRVPVLICGGGPVGLALAVELGLRRHTVPRHRAEGTAHTTAAEGQDAEHPHAGTLSTLGHRRPSPRGRPAPAVVVPGRVVLHHPARDRDHSIPRCPGPAGHRSVPRAGPANAPVRHRGSSPGGGPRAGTRRAAPGIARDRPPSRGRQRLGVRPRPGRPYAGRRCRLRRGRRRGPQRGARQHRRRIRRRAGTAAEHRCGLSVRRPRLPGATPTGRADLGHQRRDPGHARTSRPERAVVAHRLRRRRNLPRPRSAPPCHRCRRAGPAHRHREHRPLGGADGAG